MAAIERGDGDYVHLEMVPEPSLAMERRRQQARPPLPPVPASREEQGARLARSTSEALARAAVARQDLGIDPSGLLVLELTSLNQDLRTGLETYLAARIVEERKDRVAGGDFYRVLVQFPDDRSLERLRREIALYQQESSTRARLAPAMRRNFFDALRDVRTLTREDRIGRRLQQEGFPDREMFYMDVDLWHPGTEDAALDVLDRVQAACRAFGGELEERIRTSTLLLGKVRGSPMLGDALLDLDLVARLDLPPRIEDAYSRMFIPAVTPESLPQPDESDPLVCVVDSGVVAGHPMLIGWVIEERDFDSGELTTADLNGHGTSVAGLVVYGDVAQCIAKKRWTPRVRLCSAKILRNEPNPAEPDQPSVVFPEENRVEAVTEEVIRYFANDRGCRIFNISVGSSTDVYSGGRQFAWAEKLDELARELDIVVVVSAGNNSNPPIPTGAAGREQMQKQVREQMLGEQQRVINPATSALALTVGSVARSAAVYEDGSLLRIPDAFAAAPVGGPSPFSRTGFGYTHDRTKASIKPDLVHFGGNYALRQLAGGPLRWVTQNILMGEPTIRLERDGRFVGALSGTSYAAPHVAHAAASAMVGLESALGRTPSANLIRAVVGSTAATPECGMDWLGGENEALRLVGYGMCSEDGPAWSQRHRVRLVAEGEIAEDTLEVYRIQVPELFLTEHGCRGITVALAYDPPVRASRKEYLARTMWLEVFNGLTDNQVMWLRSRYRGEEELPIPSGATMDLRPTKSQVQWSTLQVRSKQWQRRPALRRPVGEDEPTIHVLVGCQQRFPTSHGERQRYGLVLLFWHEGARVDLYQPLSTRVRVRAPRVRVEA